MAQLDGKIALVTGGNSGIGLAVADRFAREGAKVFITARREPELARAADKIGRGVEAIPADLAHGDGVRRLLEAIRVTADRLDIVVASAGIAEPASLEATSEDQFDRTFATNVRSPLFLVQQARPLMTEGGAIS